MDTSERTPLPPLSLLKKSEVPLTFEQPKTFLLEKFHNPFANRTENPYGVSGEIKITCPEFTSLCPLTGQPDFATIKINYLPKDTCVESKSLKLYLASFRNTGEFHESCVARIIKDLIKLLDPYQITVIGEFTPRGGIPFWPTARYVRPDCDCKKE